VTPAGSQLIGRALRRISLAAILILSILSTGRSVLADWPSLAGRYVYVISRNGNPIGQQSLDIQAEGAAVTATTETRIVVTFLGMTVYTMNQRIAETYASRELIRLVSETDDDGDVRKVDLTRDGKMLKGTFNGEARAFFCDCMASTMWHADSLVRDNIVEASRARLRHVKVEDRGLETLALPIGSIEARHIVVTGELEREVWYDAAGILVASVLKGRDGSTIRQELLQRP
jgi:hypothetical protein